LRPALSDGSNLPGYSSALLTQRCMSLCCSSYIP
jgi:hypothetical protein